MSSKVKRLFCPLSHFVKFASDLHIFEIALFFKLFILDYRNFKKSSTLDFTMSFARMTTMARKTVSFDMSKVTVITGPIMVVFIHIQYVLFVCQDLFENGGRLA